MGVADTFSLLDALPAEQRLPFIEAALREPYVELQAAAFRALSDPEGLSRPDLIIQHYPDLTAEVRQMLLRQPLLFRDAAWEELRSPREWSRRSAYQVLAALNPKEAVTLLARGLHDSSSVVRESVADALEAIANRHYYHLVAARLHEDPESRRYLSENRAGMMDALGPLLRAFPLHAKRVFLDLVIESGEEAYPLVAELLQTRYDPATFAAFVHALSTALSEPAIDLLFRLYLDPRPRLHEAAVDVLQLRRDPGFPALVATVLSRLPPERLDQLALRTKELSWWHTVEAAPDIDPFSAARLMDFIARSSLEPRNRDLALRFFRESPYAEVRVHLLSILLHVGSPELQDLAVAFLQDPSDEVKIVAARTLIGLNPPNKTRLLLPLLNAASEDLRRMAMREVAASGFEKYLRAFDRLDASTREAAAKALVKIDPRIVDRLAEEIHALDPERRLKALRVVDYVDAETDLRPNLMSLLNDPDRRVRATAIKIVQLTESADGMRFLAAALQDPDRRIRANAIEAFEDGGDVRATKLLRPLLEDADNRVRANAAKALWTLGQDEGRDALARMLHDPAELMRLSAAWAIGEARFPGAFELLAARVEAETSPIVRARISDAMARASETGAA